MPAIFYSHPCSVSRPLRGKLAAALFMLLAAGHTAAQSDPPRLAAEAVNRHPAGSIQSTEQADAALADVSRTRKEIEARYTEDERACHPKFFVTSCVDKIKEWRREELQKLRKVEIEANAYMRQERAASRDAALTEKQLKEESRQPAQNAQQAERQRKQPSQPRQPEPSRDRVAEHEAREKQRQAGEEAGAAERAANVAAYERKAEASRKRQEEVAKRKAAKEERRRAKEAGEAKPSSSAPAELKP